MEFISFATAWTKRLDARQISRSGSLCVRMMVHFVRGKSWIRICTKRFPEDEVCCYVGSFNLRVVEYIAMCIVTLLRAQRYLNGQCWCEKSVTQTAIFALAPIVKSIGRNKAT